jgi:exosortase/archaeosortase family protein
VAGGALLLWRAPLPRLPRAPRAAVALAGLAAALGVLAYDALRHAPLDPPKVAIVALGLATALAAPFARREKVASALLWSLPAAWAPLAVWAAQGAMKTAWGATPLEAFIRYGLLLPLAAVLRAMGRAPSIDGQVITYATPHGPFSLEVGVACSGLQAMALFGALLAVLILVERPPSRQALAWSAIGIAGVYATNVVRLVTLALVGSAWGSNALETAHANAGWLFFVAWSAGFAALYRVAGRRGLAGAGRRTVSHGS